MLGTASNVQHTVPPARPVHSWSASKVGEGRAEISPASSNSLSLPTVAGVSVQQPTVAPLSGGCGEIANRLGTVKRGPTFALMRSARDASTEGVMAPTWLLAQGISNMLDLAAAYDSEAEVRVVSSATTQPEQGMIARAWAVPPASAYADQAAFPCLLHVQPFLWRHTHDYTHTDSTTTTMIDHHQDNVAAWRSDNTGSLTSGHADTLRVLLGPLHRQ